MGKCRHKRTVMWLPAGTYPASFAPWTKRCVGCNEWLSLGPANDEPDAVQFEIEVAEWLALAGNASWFPWTGLIALNPGTHASSVLCAARDIFTHEGGDK